MTHKNRHSPKSVWGEDPSFADDLADLVDGIGGAANLERKLSAAVSDKLHAAMIIRQVQEGALTQRILSGVFWGIFLIWLTIWGLPALERIVLAYALGE